MAPRHADMHVVDPQLWGGAVRCQKSNSKDFFSSLLGAVSRSFQQFSHRGNLKRYGRVATKAFISLNTSASFEKKT
jgi:hypothetical protein